VGHLFTNSPLVWQPSHTVTINENNQDVEFRGSNLVRIIDGEIFENDRVFSDGSAGAAGGFQGQNTGSDRKTLKDWQRILVVCRMSSERNCFESGAEQMSRPERLMSLGKVLVSCGGGQVLDHPPQTTTARL